MKEAEQNGPKTEDDFFNRAFEKQNLGYNEEAIQDYTEVLKLKPDYTSALYNRGLLKKDLCRYEEAVKDFNEAIRLKPGDPVSFYHLGLTYLLLKLTKEAEKNFDRSLQLAKNYQFPKQGKALIYLFQEQGIKAEEIFNQISRYYTGKNKGFMLIEQLCLYTEKAQACMVWGFNKLAEKAITQGLNLKNDYLPLLQLQAKFSEIKSGSITPIPTIGNSEKNDELAQKLQEGHVHRELKEFDRAIACYEDVLKLDKTNIQAMLYKGIIYEIRDEIKNAEFCYKIIIEMHSDSSDKASLLLAQEKLAQLKRKQVKVKKIDIEIESRFRDINNQEILEEVKNIDKLKIRFLKPIININLDVQPKISLPKESALETLADRQIENEPIAMSVNSLDVKGLNSSNFFKPTAKPKPIGMRFSAVPEEGDFAPRTNQENQM